MGAHSNPGKVAFRCASSCLILDMLLFGKAYSKGVSFLENISNLSLSYDRLCNPLTCHFRVFGTTFFVAHKQAKFLQSKLADVIREFDFSEHQFLSFERHSQSDKHARALEFFLQRYPPPPLISTWIFGFYETGFLTL